MTHNAPIRAAAKGLARIAGEAEGKSGQSLGDHIEATWEQHVPAVCAVLDAVSVNLDGMDDQAHRGMSACREQHGFRPATDLPHALMATKFILWAIRDEGPR